jgi:hypothetical protein
MPFWVAQPEVDEAGSAPQGQLLAETITSRSLGGPRRVWFYLPPGYGAAPTSFVLRALDGEYVQDGRRAP